MKKTLSIVLALALAVSMFASFALIAAPADPASPFSINFVKVTNAAGYAMPYVAVDDATAYVENQATYVVVGFTLMEADPGDLAPVANDADPLVVDEYVTTITSSTLDLSYAETTDQYQEVLGDGSISARGALPAGMVLDYDAPEVTITIDGANLVADQAILDAIATGTNSQKYFFTFVAVTKAATAGEVKASLARDTVEFADADGSTLSVFENGVVKYTIERIGAAAPGNDFAVYDGTIAAGELPMFTYLQTGAHFDGIGYEDSAAVNTVWTYDGKLLFLGADNALGGSGVNADVDLTATVAAVNTFFGFSFQYDNAAGEGDFEAKTAGNPVVVTDTYAYVTAVVTEPDDGIDIAPTGDFSANIVIVMAASAVLAAAALAFVAKKARD